MNMKELEELDVSQSMAKTVSILTNAIAAAQKLIDEQRREEAKPLLDLIVKKVIETEEYFWRPVDSDEVYNSLSEIFRKMGDEKGAEDWKKRVNLRKARDIEFMGRVQNFCGNNTLALDYYTKAVNLAPDFQLAQDGKKRAEKSVMKAKREIDVLENAIAKNPGDVELLVKLGTVKLNLNRAEDAINDLKKALSVSPEHIEANTRLGLALLSMGKYEEAKGLFEKVLASKPGSLNAKRGRNYANYFLGLETLAE